MPPLPLAAATASSAAHYESEEERSLLFSDSDAEQEEEISQADDHNDTQNDNLQWEDFMSRYWNLSATNGDEFQIADDADKILLMEDGDMMPHPLEPELDDMSYKSNNDNNNDDDVIIDMKNNDSMALIKILSEVGLQSTLEMAKLHHHHAGSTADHYSNHHSKSSKKKEAAEDTKSNHRTTTQLKKKKKQLQDEFVIDMSNIPISVSKKTKKRAKKAAAIVNVGSSGGGVQNGQQEMASPGSSSTRGGSHPTKYSQSSTLMQPASSPQQHEESLEDSLLAMAKRLSPGNDDNDIEEEDQMIIPQQHDQISMQQQPTPPNHPLSSSSSTSILSPPPPINSSPLPNQNLIHQLGPIQTRTSLRSLLMKKWHHSWWMHYDTTSLLVFRSKDHLDDWVQNPYHGKREREYLVKLRVDFGDIVGASAASGAGASANNNSGGVSAHQGQSSSGEINNKESSGNNSILGHRILPIKQKSYHKNEPQMFQFKLERWTNMGVSVLAAFASEEEKEVQLLYDTILGIMERCPFGGLHNIDHMLKH